MVRHLVMSEAIGSSAVQDRAPGALFYFISLMYFTNASICCSVSLPLYAGILFFPSEIVFFSAERDIFSTPGS